MRAKIAVVLLATLATSMPASAVQIFYQQGFTANIFVYDSVTDLNSLLGTTGGPADSFGMAFAPDGTLYAHDRETESLYTIDTATGAATLVGVTGVNAEDLTVDLAGTTGYVSAGNTLYAVNLATGAATALGPIATTLDGLTTAPVAVNVNGTMYPAGTIFGVDTGSFWLVDVALASLTSLGSITGADETFDFGPDGTLFGHNDSGSFFSFGLNPVSATFLGNSTPSLVFGMAVRDDAAPVPEPATGILLGLGLASLAARRRNRTKA